MIQYKRRNTKQKSQILSVIKKLDHPTAEEIYIEVIQTMPKVSRATIYRHLGVMIEDGNLTKVSIPNGPDRFDLKTENHAHFRCTNCDKLYDIDIPKALKDNQEQILSDYFVGSITLSFTGICRDCLKERRTSRKIHDHKFQTA